MTRERLEKLVEDKAFEINDKIKETAWEFITLCIKNETKKDFNLISNRHIDVIMLCSVFLSLYQDKDNHDVEMDQVINVYSKHPQYLTEAFDFNLDHLENLYARSTALVNTSIL